MSSANRPNRLREERRADTRRSTVGRRPSCWRRPLIVRRIYTGTVSSWRQADWSSVIGAAAARRGWDVRRNAERLNTAALSVSRSLMTADVNLPSASRSTSCHSGGVFIPCLKMWRLLVCNLKINFSQYWNILARYINEMNANLSKAAAYKCTDCPSILIYWTLQSITQFDAFHTPLLY